MIVRRWFLLIILILFSIVIYIIIKNISADIYLLDKERGGNLAQEFLVT